MEHIHFKEKFTKKKCTGRQHQSSSCGMEEGGGGHKTNLHHLHPLLNSLYSSILKFISQKKRLGEIQKQLTKYNNPPPPLSIYMCLIYSVHVHVIVELY